MSLCIHKESLWAHFIAKGGVAIHVKIIYIYYISIIISTFISSFWGLYMLWVFSGTFICYMPLYTLFLQEISLFVYPSSQLIHGLFWTFIDVPRDSNYISRQRFYRYFEYTNMCSLIKCMVYCIVLSSLGCRFKNSQIVIIFFKHEHLLKVLVKLWRFCWL